MLGWLLFDWDDWALRCRGFPGTLPDTEYGEKASKLAMAFWGRIGEFLMRSRTCSELGDDEKALWVQSGLAVSPLMGTCLQYSLDFCLAWALIGEWTSRVLFPVPKGQWPRHGHSGCFRVIRVGRPGLLRGQELPLNKRGSLPCYWCLALPRYSVSQETGCSKLKKLCQASSDLSLCMRMVVPRLVWRKPWRPLPLRDGYLWLPPCWGQRANRQCGQVWGSAR